MRVSGYIGILNVFFIFIFHGSFNNLFRILASWFNEIEERRTFKDKYGDGFEKWVD